MHSLEHPQIVSIVFLLIPIQCVSSPGQSRPDSTLYICLDVCQRWFLLYLLLDKYTWQSVFSQQLAYRPNSTEHKCESRKATPGLHAARLVLMYVRRPGLIGLRQVHKYNNIQLQKYAKTHIQKYTNTFILKYANTCGPVGLDVCPPRLAGPNRPPNGLLQGSAVHGFGDLYWSK